jgi:hypothetical protein
MALKKKIEAIAFGKNIVVDAYIKVDSISGNKQTVSYSVITFADDKKSVVVQNTYYFVPDMNGANFIHQAYEHLKTLPDFADAVDC